VVVKQEKLKKIGERIRILRKLSNTNVDYICRIAGVNYHTWYRWEGGQFITYKAIRYVKYAFIQLGISCEDEWIISGKGPDPLNLKKYTLNDFKNPTDSIKIYYEIKDFKSNYPESIIIMNISSSVSPDFEVGDYVGGIVIPQKNINKYNGNYCIVDIHNENRCIRKFQYIEKKYVFSSTTQKYTYKEPYITSQPPEMFFHILFHRRPLFCNSFEKHEGDIEL
jgi:hypothetical protein